MTDKNLARRAAVKVYFADVDISSDLDKYLISLSYTENEEDETDDLQIKLHDRDNIWLEKWLNNIIDSAAAGITNEQFNETVKSTENNNVSTYANTYVVKAKSGLNVRSGKGTNYSKLGLLAYGSTIEVSAISDQWAEIKYSGKTGYVHADYIEKTHSTVKSSGKWNIGDDVEVSGRPQYSSYGMGTPGANVTNYRGKITYLNLKNGIPYPICVGYLGWFAENQVLKIGETTKETVVGTASKGLRIQAAIVRQNWNSDGKDDLLECGQFELDNVSASGPPATITIKGTSLPYSSSIRQTEKSKSWESYNLSGIADEIATKNGMTCMYLSAYNPSYQRVEQYRQSDISFLKKLCQDAGCSLKVSNNIIIIFEQSEYEKKSVVKVIERGKSGGYLKYSLKTGKDDTYTSCRVSYVTSAGKNITATAYIEDYKEDDKDNQCLEINQKVSSTAEAQALAEKILRLHNKYELTASFTFEGDPKLLSGNTVELVGWGAWNGRYIIKQSKHSVSNSGYTTQIELRKTLA